MGVFKLLSASQSLGVGPTPSWSPKPAPDPCSCQLLPYHLARGVWLSSLGFHRRQLSRSPLAV